MGPRPLPLAAAPASRAQPVSPLATGSAEPPPAGPGLPGLPAFVGAVGAYAPIDPPGANGRVAVVPLGQFAIGAAAAASQLQGLLGVVDEHSMTGGGAGVGLGRASGPRGRYGHGSPAATKAVLGANSPLSHLVGVVIAGVAGEGSDGAVVQRVSAVRSGSDVRINSYRASRGDYLNLHSHGPAASARLPGGEGSAVAREEGGGCVQYPQMTVVLNPDAARPLRLGRTYGWSEANKITRERDVRVMLLPAGASVYFMTSVGLGKRDLPFDQDDGGRIEHAVTANGQTVASDSLSFIVEVSCARVRAVVCSMWTTPAGALGAGPAGAGGRA